MMKILSSEVTKLLDKLYNLRGEDSAILLAMEQEKEEALKTRDETSKQKAELQTQINELNSKESVLEDEGKKLLFALSQFHKEEFENVVQCLNVDFDPEAIRNKVEKTLPLTLDKFASEKKTAGEELVKVEDKMNEAITKIEELGIRKDEALANQERLNRYFELALGSNINITRDEITTLLEKFGFSDEEQRAAAKLLMFPEDGLFEYENNIKELNKPKTSKEEIKETKKDEPVVEISPLVETPVITETLEEIITSEDKSEVLSQEIGISKEESSEVNKEVLIKTLSELGFDYLDLTSNDFNKLMENYDVETFKKNVDTMTALKINLDVFVDNVELLYDKEMDSKVERLTKIGKLPQDIYLNPNVLIKYSLNELDEAIKTLSESGLEPKNVPLMAY